MGLLAGLAALSHSWTVPFAFAAMLALSFAFSGHSRAEAARYGDQAEDRYLLKPVGPDVLAAAVRDVPSRSRVPAR